MNYDRQNIKHTILFEIGVLNVESSQNNMLNAIINSYVTIICALVFQCYGKNSTLLKLQSMRYFVCVEKN